MVNVLWLLNTALKDLFSRKTRSILTIASIAIGIALLFSLISLVNGVESRSATMIRQLTSADIIIRNITRVDTSTGIPSPEGTRGFIRPITLSLINESILQNIESIESIYYATSLLTTQAYVDETPIILQGVIPGEYELVAGSLNIINGRSLSCLNCPEVVVGKSLMERLNLSVGGTLTITVNNTQVYLNVVGVYESGVQFFEMMNVYVPLYFLQNITGRVGLVSEILIKLKNPGDAQSVASYIQSIYPDLRATLQTAQIQQASQLISTLTTFFLTIGLIAIIAGGFGVANTMLINVFERMREIGILRAIGASSRTILLMFLTEALVLGLFGGVTGICTGFILAYILPNYFPIQTASRILPGSRAFGGSPQITQISITPVITWDTIMLALIIGVIVSLLAGLYPAWRASRIKPIEVLRHG